MADAVLRIPIPGQKNHAHSGERERFPLDLLSPYFLAGPENHLVEVVVRSILQEPPNGYNPVILYGPSGVGKSHLALGLAAEWKEKHRRQRVECTTALDFSRELADAIETQGVEEFREKYRQAALVVIEDIHRLGRKGTAPCSRRENRGSPHRPEKLNTQEELVHTLDALIRNGAWFLLTSTIAPGDGPGISPMLQSRLMSGLIVPLALPGFSTRLSIIQQHSGLLKYDLSKSAAEALAERLQGTVPEIQQMIARLKIPRMPAGKRISAQAAKHWFDRPAPRSAPSLQKIAALTAKHFGLKAALLRSPSRKRNIVAARDLAIHLARQLLNFSFEEIGRFFGGRDHTTIMHSCRKVEALVKTDAACRRDWELLKTKACRHSEKMGEKMSNPC
jgi:chromosomal replication initiator protein